MMPLKPLAAVLAAVFYSAATPVLAYDERIVLAPNGTEVFRVRYHAVGDGQFIRPIPDLSSESTWNLSDTQKRNITAAASYWAEVIHPLPGSFPAVVNVGTVDPENAFGTSIFLTDEEFLYTGLQAAFQSDEAVPDELLDHGSHAQFVMGRLEYAEGEYLPSQIGMTEDMSITAVAVHELAHSLGVMNMAGDVDGKATPYFSDMLDIWAAHLVDDNGNPARPNQPILCADCRNPYDPDGFDARLDKAMFVGENVHDALEGGLPGVPVRMLSEYVSGAVGVDRDYMSHIELRNSLMSHQSYRNYAQFMEAELAIVQDLGYTVDRRNFFGRSVYGSGLSIVNDRGFYARNADGTEYLPGQYNTATVGLGLHVYGSDNEVRQTADLLAKGAGAAGIRVDGENNTIVVDPGVRVHALGLNGQGIMFAYGKGHQLVHRGEIRATGDMGVGLRFDFGHNLMGDWMDYRGSYIRTSELAESPPMLAELQGPLADQVDITGSIAGSRAAIYMSPNALVGSINIMQGARIEGDIVSEYAERDEAGRPRLTTVSFGRQADVAGRATGRADNAFAMRYVDDIRGRNNLHVSLDGGATILDGRNELHGMTIHPGATLAGNGQFNIHPEGVLRNEGVVAPGYPMMEQAAVAEPAAGDSIGRIHVDGNFEQTQTGVLAADFAATGAHDSLAVSGIARLDGTLALQARPGWYANDWTLDANVVEATRTEGEFASTGTGLVSPSLEFQTDALGEGRYRLAARRAPDAYSRHAQDDNGRRVGQALQRAAGALGSATSTATPPDEAAFSEFLAALDFSSPSGSEITRTLEHVSPAAYSAGVSASLHRERDVMDASLQGLRTPAFGPARNTQGSAAPGSWQGFASAFGGKADQDQRGSAVGYDVSTYGLVVGATQQLEDNPAIRVGGHLDIAHQSYSPDAPLSGKGRTTSFGLGLQAGYAPKADEGVYAWSGLRFGIEDASMKRHVSTVGHTASHSADWTGRSASAAVGGGYRWKLAPGISAGPVASLNYALVSRPDISENGHAATRLSLDSERFDALRSSMGLAANGTWAVKGDAAVSAYAQATWDREWMDRDAVQTASFAAVPTVSFTSRNRVVPKDSLGLQVGVNYQHDARMTVGAGLTGRFGGGYDAVSGELRLRWAF